MAVRAKPKLGFSEVHLRPASPLTRKQMAVLAGMLPLGVSPRAIKGFRSELRQIAIEYLSAQAQLSNHGLQTMGSPPRAGDPMVTETAPTRAETNRALADLLQRTKKLLVELGKAELPVPFVAPGNDWMDNVVLALWEVERLASNGLRGPEDGLSKGRRRILTAVSAEVHAVLMYYSGLGIDTQFAIVVQMPSGARGLTDGPADFRASLDRFRDKIEGVLEGAKKVTGQDPRNDLKQATGRLSEAWAAATGRNITHTPRGKAGDNKGVGRPHSQFGKFVVAFFRVVDPRVYETTISNAIRPTVVSRASQKAGGTLQLPDGQSG